MQSTLSLNLLQARIRNDKPLRQDARITNRILSDLEVKGTLRPAPGEFNSGMNIEEQDVSAAELIRTSKNIVFCGKVMLMRLER